MKKYENKEYEYLFLRCGWASTTSATGSTRAASCLPWRSSSSAPTTTSPPGDGNLGVGVHVKCCVMLYRVEVAMSRVVSCFIWLLIG